MRQAFQLVLLGVTMKKFSAIILCFLFLITCGLAGCAGFSVNRVKYYNEVVATVGNTNITRYELLSAFNSYGNTYYVQQMGKSEEEAMRETLNLLMDRESLYQYAKNEAKYKPTAYQVNSVIEKMFDSLDSSMETYIKQAKRIYAIEIKDEESKKDSETAYKYSDYNTELKGKRARLETDVQTVYYTDDTKQEVSATPTEFSELKNVDYIAYIVEEEPSFDCVLGETHVDALVDFESDATLDLIIDTYFDKLYDSLENEEKRDLLFNKAKELLAKDLISGEKYLLDENGKAYNTVSKDVIYRYFKKTYKDNIKSQYLTNVRTNYLNNAKHELSIDALLDKYVSMVETSYNKYANFESTYKDAMKNAGTKADDILYHPTLSDGTQFGYFIHTLIKFDDEQTASIKNLAKFKDVYSKEKYNALYNSIISKTTAEERDATTGLIAEDAKTYSLNEILAEYRNVTNLDEFIQFMFRFTEDTATLSQGMPYVVGTKGNSAMETAFTDEAVRLIEQGVEGAMTPATTNTDSSKGEVMCISSYGIHFLYYIGEVDTFDVPFGEISSAYIAKENKAGNGNNLYKKEINPLTHETYFDMLFDAVYPASSSDEVYASSNGYTARETELIQTMRKTNPAKIYETKLKGTKSSL